MHIYMPIQVTYYPQSARLGLFLNLDNAKNACEKSSNKSLTWTDYGKVMQANEEIQYTIQTLEIDDWDENGRQGRSTS